MNSLSETDDYMFRIPRGFLSSPLYNERPITVDEACGIRLLLFGDTVKSFGSGWTLQGFKFRTHPSYGIKQKYAGPCGLLAAVQSQVIFELLFGYSRIVLNYGLLRPGLPERIEALARALSYILWQAGDHREALVAMIGERMTLSDSTTTDILAGDGVLEYIKIKYFRSLDSLLEYIYNFIQEFIKDGGCILFVYSLILTHGIDKMKNEMDYPDNHLIGSDEYASQELVNLILTGKASSNVFNGDIEWNLEETAATVRKGIPRQSKIGFLSQYDYLDTCPVGSFYKDPEYPIWVIYGDSHFSVLFGTSRNIFKYPTETFRVFYYDCLCRRNLEDSYVIKPYAKVIEIDRSIKPPPYPVVDCCIYTRWPFAELKSEILTEKCTVCNEWEEEN